MSSIVPTHILITEKIYDYTSTSMGIRSTAPHSTRDKRDTKTMKATIFEQDKDDTTSLYRKKKTQMLQHFDQVLEVHYNYHKYTRNINVALLTQMESRAFDTHFVTLLIYRANENLLKVAIVIIFRLIIRKKRIWNMCWKCFVFESAFIDWPSPGTLGAKKNWKTSQIWSK